MTIAYSQELISAKIAEFQVMTPEQRARIRMENYNRSAGTLDAQEYDCPKCMNRGHFQRLRKDLSVYMEDCDCMAIRRSIWSAKNAELYDRLLQCDFPRFRTEAKWQQEMKQTALHWAMQANKEWLMLCGQSGCGKSHLTMAAVGYRIFHRSQRVTFLDWRKFNLARECDKERFWEQLDKSEKAEILFIDDLLKLDSDRSFLPSPEKELAFQIINTRSNRSGITVISTELTPEQLLKIDQATASRLLSMAKQYKFTVSPDIKKNRRLQ